ncbi:MAG: UbiA family prenyltransferase [Longimicrobiales bacterium]
MPPLLRALRPHQWAKNLLILLPALAAHRVPGAGLLGALVAAVASFSLLASAVYLVNDVVDVESDRAHPSKRHRPIAAGQLGVPAALTASGTLAVLSLALALTLPPAFLQVWIAYLVVTSAYSAGLKRRVVLDVVVLSGLYTARVLAGAGAAGVPLSPWFLAFSIFLFVSLALLKRTVESVGADHRDTGGFEGRGWRVEDQPVLVAMGTACAVGAALVYCLYITGDDVLRLYRRPEALWFGLPVLLYWLTRAWLLAVRGQVEDDPVVFALKDPASYASLALFGLAVWWAT